MTFNVSWLLIFLSIAWLWQKSILQLIKYADNVGAPGNYKNKTICNSSIFQAVDYMENEY